MGYLVVGSGLRRGPRARKGAKARGRDTLWLEYRSRVAAWVMPPAAWGQGRVLSACPERLHAGVLA